MKRLVLALCLAVSPVPALAHKVIAAVFPSGDMIEGEIGFSSGVMAADLAVSVTEPDGTPLGTTQTDADGFFVFRPTAPVIHVFRADLGAGHVAEVSMSAEDVATVLGRPVASTATLAYDAAVAPVPNGPALGADQRALIAEIVRDEVRPLRREIAAYKEHNDFQSILGGMGYICGLFGVGFYIMARRKMKENA